jgi:hypothetical protein
MPRDVTAGGENNWELGLQPKTFQAFAQRRRQAACSRSGIDRFFMIPSAVACVIA